MTSKRRTEITIETRTVTVIRTRNAKAVYCEKCSAEVRIFWLTEIASDLCIENVEIEQLSRAGKIHFIGSTEMLCSNSIGDYFINK
jgi:hypothetical protein